ncbi:NADH-quinone oxidoreductase subunit NuoF [Geopsychrobacter electrodiphilus]|uniref:NADH-quinone oxidoreductase subunit NuoF n=1 Tax=Geopsychrobacter electrodiphilus TaxID=225196 RepID=UPI00037577AD|nr:NADH-quinone oxidoreductase subunit NuoF [Geopsychrobacter electrodiphilus]
MSATPQLLFKNRVPGKTVSYKDYCKTGGYTALEKALKGMSPAEIVTLVKASGLRGRGGAGFSTGLKWSFFPADKPAPKYLVCNCDEMEPGTYKDGELLAADPHQLIEGMILSAYALNADTGYIFIRYAYDQQLKNLQQAVAEATAAGYLGKNICGSGFDFELHLHGSAGRYILGEETALLNGLEGQRPNPRLKPPFPAQSGLFGRPTTVNNVETLANIPHIVNGGAEWFKGLARNHEGAGTKLFGLSGHLNVTECFELPVGIPLGELIEAYGGGVWRNRKFKACLPGGASTPYLTGEHLDIALDFDPLAAVGSRFGTAGVTVFDDQTCMLRVTLNLLRFFARESCGWCTPCRDGLPLVCWLLEKIENGEGTLDDLQMLRDQQQHISGRSFCALADGAMGPLDGLLRLFEQEVIDHIDKGRCPF